jgi:4-carboxymuconolactone decarboxylase
MTCEFAMKMIAAIASLVLATSSWAQGRPTTDGRKSHMQTRNDIGAVAPALAKYAQATIAGLWQGPGLAPRDRSIVTVSALIARNLTSELADQLNPALDNGVKPRELSEIITHLAFYSG